MPAVMIPYNGTGPEGADPLEFDVNVWYEVSDGKKKTPSPLAVYQTPKIYRVPYLVVSSVHEFSRSLDQRATSKKKDFGARRANLRGGTPPTPLRPQADPFAPAGWRYRLHAHMHRLGSSHGPWRRVSFGFRLVAGGVSLSFFD